MQRREAERQARMAREAQQDAEFLARTETQARSVARGEAELAKSEVLDARRDRRKVQCRGAAAATAKAKARAARVEAAQREEEAAEVERAMQDAAVPVAPVQEGTACFQLFWPYANAVML